ncbi:hypothetical protein C0992_003285 [Termitomyces sp. T32_za158]|nr:hypothetical protein C0992_003285 [Termitomyces sp. T32_za158]
MEEDYRRAAVPRDNEDAEEEVKEEKALVEVPEEVLVVLEKLVADVRNEVWLLSGLRVRGLLERIGRRVPRLGIVAENGCFIKTIKSVPKLTRSFSAGSSFSPPKKYIMRHMHERSVSNGAAGAAAAGGWVNMVANFNLTWKSPCLEILHYFAERTPGSFIEERDASIVFRFWTGAMPVDGVAEDPDRTWARRQAAEAQNHIFDSLGERYGLRIIPGRNSFLVLPNNVSRSTAVGAILHPGGPARSVPQRAWVSHDAFDAEAQSGAGDVDFILAVSGDEKLLRRLNEVDGAETCSTSGRGTDAKWKVEPEPRQALRVLGGLVGCGSGDV